MESFEFPVPIFDFAIALFIGALVGIEREKKQEFEGERGTAGLRTFLLFAEAGAVAAWLSQERATPWIFLGVGALVTAIVVAGYLAAARARREHVGVTTEIAALVVYLLGGTVLFGHAELAVALAIVTSAVLAFKQPLHESVERIGRDDLYAGLKLLIATFIVLPVLPNRPIDPWGALNPYQMWWLVILISGLSLVGYVATRWLGPGRGIALTGLFGGLVSSTAVTLSLARRSREPGGARLADALAVGILLSWTVMFVRIAIVAGLLAPDLLAPIGVPLALLTLVALATAGARQRRIRGSAASAEEEVPLRNPFSLTAAVRFALLFAAVLLVVAIAQRWAPRSGVVLVAALAGATDVDAITLSLAGSAAGGELDIGLAAMAILIAALSNTAVKLGMTWTLGAPALRRPVAIAGALLLVAGAASLGWLLFAT